MSLASSLGKLPVLGSRTAVFFELLKFCRSSEKIFCRPFFSFLFGEHLRLSPCLWPQAFLFLASRGSVLGLVLELFFVPGLGLEPCVINSTSVQEK